MNSRRTAYVTNFNSQPHEEADIHVLLKDVRFRYFNSQPHEEADWSSNFWAWKT